MASRVNSAQSKLDKYYTKTNDSPIYIVALVLDPCIKWDYITSTWPEKWIPDAKALVAKLWKKYQPTATTTTTPLVKIQEKSNPNIFTTWKH